MPLLPPILPAETFYLAEDYHQKYYLRRQRVLAQDFGRAYPNEADFINSTAVMRVNGLLGGHGDFAKLQQDVADYGLSERGQNILLKEAERWQGYWQKYGRVGMAC